MRTSRYLIIHHRPLWRRRGGYSLIEVLMTSLIIQIIAGMVAVSVSNVAAAERTSYAGQEVVTALRYARQLAQSSGTPSGVVFDATNQTVSVFSGTPTTIVPNNAMPGGVYTVNLNSQANTHGVMITSVSLAGDPNNNMVCYGTTQPKSGIRGLGSTTNNGFVVLSQGTGSVTVNIPVIGEPTLQ
jgi:Tfp pilus assembly protein FimT